MIIIHSHRVHNVYVLGFWALLLFTRERILKPLLGCLNHQSRWSGGGGSGE